MNNSNTIIPSSEIQHLRDIVLFSLRNQGFSFDNEKLILPDQSDKVQIRRLHEVAVNNNVLKGEGRLKRHESKLLKYIASGDEVIPRDIQPRLVEVHPDKIETLLFHYIRLHWSIPVSGGYGRRLRYVVYDDSNGKVIGVFGLGDPVFSLGARDNSIGWSHEDRRKRLKYVMDLFVLGAIPPYSELLCGKLIALLATSTEVQEDFKNKYKNRKSLISQNKYDGNLALLTTTSALGKSSIYNRLKFNERKVFQSVGFTRGSGEFHFSNGCYSELRDFAQKYCPATDRHKNWGSGFRNRREIVRKVLPKIGLPSSFGYHGVQREVFTAALSSNCNEFLRGQDSQINPVRSSTAELFAWFRERWLLPRANRIRDYINFNKDSYRLWYND